MAAADARPHASIRTTTSSSRSAWRPTASWCSRPTSWGSGGAAAGILIPATAAQNRRLVWAEVVQVGPTVRNVEDGDHVLFAPDAGFEVEIRGEEYLHPAGARRPRDRRRVGASGQTGLYL